MVRGSCLVLFFFFQAEDGIRDGSRDWSSDVCSSDLVTLAELRYGVAKSAQREKNGLALDEFLLPLEVADFDEPAAVIYGMVRAGLEKAGTPIGPLDTQISAHALSLGATLVSHNTRAFRRIPGLP